MSNSQTSQYTAGTAISVIFQRELRENLLKKSMLITLLLAIVATVGGITAAWYFTKDDTTETTRLAVVGDAPFARGVAETTSELAAEDKNGEASPAQSAPFASTLGVSLNKVELLPTADIGAARDAVANGDAEAALYPGDTAGNWVFLDEDAPSWLPAMLQEALTGQTQAAQITALGGNPAEFAQGLAGATVSVEKLEEDTIDYTAIIVVGIGVMVMITGILMFGGAVAQSVIEEKSSRVIEIMLSSVRPMHLLIGKILGAAVAGLVMLTALLLSAAAALIATGLARDLDIPWASLGLLVPYFLLGYFFFAALYATAGSMVSRMEDFTGAQTPVLMLSLITIYVPAFGWSNLESTFMQAMGWVPPISVTVAPLQYASGNFSLLQLLLSMLVTAVVTAVVVVLAARIYPRNVLRMGAPMSWKQALTGTTN